MDTINEREVKVVGIKIRRLNKVSKKQQKRIHDWMYHLVDDVLKKPEKYAKVFRASYIYTENIPCVKRKRRVC